MDRLSLAVLGSETWLTVLLVESSGMGAVGMVWSGTSGLPSVVISNVACQCHNDLLRVFPLLGMLYPEAYC